MKIKLDVKMKNLELSIREMKYSILKAYMLTLNVFITSLEFICNCNTVVKWTVY